MDMFQIVKRKWCVCMIRVPLKYCGCQIRLFNIYK